MKRVSLVALVLLVTLALQPQAAQATLISFEATLTGGHENPGNASSGTGEATVVIDLALNTMHVDVTFSGLTGTTTASHIHCCETTPGANANVGVATTVPTFTGFPLGVTSGTYDHIFDLTLAASYNPTFVTAEGGTVAGAEAALIAGIENQETYLNIHTNVFPGGEIRGTLVPVPEPSSLILLCSGLVGVGLMWLRRRSGTSGLGIEHRTQTPGVFAVRAAGM